MCKEASMINFQVGDLVIWMSYPDSLGLVIKIDKYVWVKWFYPESWRRQDPLAQEVSCRRLSKVS
jgi:hypothetical protein